MSERRSAVRRIPAQEEPLCGARLRAGRELSIVDISDTGALVEGAARLLPGTHVEVHVITREGRTLVRSRVTRAWVHALTADSLRYRAALAFERRVNTTADRVGATQIAPSEAFAGTVYPIQKVNGRSVEEGAC